MTPYDREQDPFWTLVQANYNPAELLALIGWASALEELERRNIRRGWPRRKG